MDGLTTLDKDTKKVPNERIANAQDARKIVDQLREADQQLRSKRRAKIQGMLDGNPPYSAANLRTKGQAHRTNINLREGEGMVDSACTPYYNLVFQVPRFAEIYLEYGDDVTRNYEWGQRMGKRYHEMLKRWKGMDKQFQLSQKQMVVHSMGPLVWKDTKDWRSTAVVNGKILVPDDTEMDVDALETMVWPRAILPGDLFKLIEESGAKTAGWRLDSCKEAIIHASPDGPTQHRDWEYYQAQIRQGDVTWNAKSKKVYVADIFQKEFDGSVSHYIILDGDSVPKPPAGQKTSPNDDYLFKKRGRFKSFCEIICPFFWDVGTGDWHSSKGLGPKIYDTCDVSNRLTGDMIDGARIGAGIILQAPDSNASQTTQIVPIGGGVVVQPGYTMLQNRIAESLQGPLAVKQDLQNTLQSNTGQYRQRVSAENQEPTLGQAQLNVQQQGQLGQGAVNRYYKSLDYWHEETLRRALKMGVALFKTHKNDTPYDYDSNTSLTDSEKGALRFIQSCVRDGVPIEALDMSYVCSITATRAVGYGSPQQQEVATIGLLQLLPMLRTEQGRVNAIRRRVALLVGQENVDSIEPPYEQADVPDDQDWAAVNENNDLKALGAETEVTDNQDHATHFARHFQSVQGSIQGAQAGAITPMQLLVHLEQAGPHMAEHLHRIANDPTRKAMVQPAAEALRGLASLSDKIKQNLAAAMQAQAGQQPQQQPDPEEQAALMKTLGELKIKEMKTRGDMQLKGMKQEQQMRLKDLQAAHDMRLKSLQAGHQIATDTAKTRAGIINDAAATTVATIAGQQPTTT